MTEFCTCGARLVEDALFCHKCARPVRELLPPEEGEAPAVPRAVAPPPLPVPEIGFSNRLAIATAMPVAGIATLALGFPLGGPLQALWALFLLPAAGFVAVYVYHRRSGAFLSVRSGARMGWLTGMFCFLIALLVIVAQTLILASRGELTGMWRKQMEQSGASGADVQEALRMLESSEGIAVILLLTVFFLFLLFTALTMIGGALGAKALERE